MECSEEHVRQRELVEDFRERLIHSYKKLVLVEDIDCSSSSSGPISVDLLYVNLSILNYHEAKRIMDQQKEISLEKLDAASKKGFAERHMQAQQLNLESLLENQDGLGVNTSLVIGNGGSGKTLTCAKIISDWMWQRAFRRFRLVVHVSGRDPELVGAKNVRGLLGLEALGYSEAQQADILNYVKRNSREVLYIIDGADEVRGGGILAAGKAIARLLQPGSRTLSSFIIMTRPCPESHNLIHVCKTHFCLIGLNDRNLWNLVTMRLGEPQGSEFMRHLEDMSMAHIKALIQDTPLFASMMAQLYEVEGGVFPETITDLFESMLRHLFERYQEKTMVHGETPVTELSAFAGLEKLAFQGMVEEKFTFNENRVSEFCPQHCLRLGLLSEVKRGCRTFTFYHLFWQEFLAARYIRTEHNIPESLEKCVGAVAVGGHTWQFWKFVAAFLPQCHVPELLFQLTSKAMSQKGFVPESTRFTCFLSACLAESLTFHKHSHMTQFSEMAAELIWPGKMPFVTDHCLSTAEAKAVGIAISAAKSKDMLQVCKCSLTEKSWQKLFSYPGPSRLLIQSSGAIDETVMQHITEALSESATLNIEMSPLEGRATEILWKAAITKNFSMLGLVDCGLDSPHLLQMLNSAPNLKCFGVTTLLVIKAQFGSTGCGQLLMALITDMPNLEWLHLVECNLNDDDLLHLLDGVATLQRLISFNASGNHLTSSAVGLVVSFALARYQMRRESHGTQGRLIVDVSSNTAISLEDVLQASQSFPFDSGVDLEYAGVVVNGRSVLDMDVASALAPRQSAYGEVDVEHKGGDLIASKVAAYLETDHEFFYVNMHRSFVGNRGMEAMSAMLLLNQTLRGLSFNKNRITEDGLKVLLSCLLHNQKLEIVNIGDNPLFSILGTNKINLRSGSNISTQQSLKILCLSGTGMTNATLENWSCAIFLELPLVTLDLSHNLISDTGVEHILQYLGESKRLEQLSLSNNCITDRGANLLYQEMNETNRETQSRSRSTCTILIGRNRVTEKFFSSNRCDLLPDDCLCMSSRTTISLQRWTGGDNPESRLACFVADACLRNGSFNAMIRQLLVSRNFETVDVWMGRLLKCLSNNNAQSEGCRKNAAESLLLWSERQEAVGDFNTAAKLLCHSLSIVDKTLTEISPPDDELNALLGFTMSSLLAIAARVPALPQYFAEFCQDAINQGQPAVARRLLEQSSFVCDRNSVENLLQW